MTIKHEIEVKSPKVLEAIYTVYGLARAKQALEDQKASSFPGFALAAALVEAEFANARAEMAGEVIREAARAGHDIGKSSGVLTSFKNGKPFVEIQFPDLADEQP